MAAVAVISPGGDKSWIDVSNNILTVRDLKQKAVEVLPWNPDHSLQNLGVTVDGKTLEESTPMSDFKFSLSSVIHLVLRVRGG